MFQIIWDANFNYYKGFFTVDDEIFPLKPWLIRPYPGSLDNSQKTFNYRLSRARRRIENAFEILVACWRMFKDQYMSPLKLFSLSLVHVSVFTAICKQLKHRLIHRKVYGTLKVLIEQSRELDWQNTARSGCALTSFTKVKEGRVTHDANTIYSSLKEYLIL